MVSSFFMRPPAFSSSWPPFFSYAFNYMGPVGSNRDEHVIIHKVADKDIDWLERPLTPEREAQRNPPGINN